MCEYENLYSAFVNKIREMRKLGKFHGYPYLFNKSILRGQDSDSHLVLDRNVVREDSSLREDANGDLVDSTKTFCFFYHVFAVAPYIQDDFFQHPNTSHKIELRVKLTKRNYEQQSFEYAASPKNVLEVYQFNCLHGEVQDPNTNPRITFVFPLTNMLGTLSLEKILEKFEYEFLEVPMAYYSQFPGRDTVWFKGLDQTSFEKMFATIQNHNEIKSLMRKRLHRLPGHLVEEEIFNRNVIDLKDLYNPEDERIYLR